MNGGAWAARGFIRLHERREAPDPALFASHGFREERLGLGARGVPGLQALS